MEPQNEAARALREECRAATAAALRILGGAAQSQASLRRRLARRGFSEQAAASAVEEMSSAGYVDDAALAESVVQRRRARRGPVRIAAELRARGVDGDVARAATGRITVEEERASAAAEARRRAPRGLPQDWTQRRREVGRIAGALQRLGFRHDAVAHALASLGAEGAGEST